MHFKLEKTGGPRISHVKLTHSCDSIAFTDPKHIETLPLIADSILAQTFDNDLLYVAIILRSFSVERRVDLCIATSKA